MADHKVDFMNPSAAVSGAPTCPTDGLLHISQIRRAKI